MWTLLGKKPLYSNSTWIAFRQNAYILHNIDLKFWQPTVLKLGKIYYVKKKKKKKIAIVFVCVRSIIPGFYCHFIWIYKCRSPKDFQVTKSRMINCNVCTSVALVFKTSRRKGHFWWHAEAKTIWEQVFKRMKQKSCWKHLNRLREICLQIWRFFFFVCFYISS